MEGNDFPSFVWIFPIIMIVGMGMFMFSRFGRGGPRPPWEGSDSERDGSAEHRMGPPFGRGGPMAPRQRPSERRSDGEGSETPLEILNRRYANGEIAKDEYEEMRETLRSSSG